MRVVAVIASALFVASAGAAPALAYTSPGSPSGYVNDFAGVLSASAKQSLENELTSFEQSTSNEIAVAIIPSMGGDYIENYAVKLFEEWKIGKAQRDNGILLVVAIEEHKMRIEVGYGLEGALPDSAAQSILNTEMTPRLKAGDYDGAVTAGVRAIELATQGEYKASEKGNSGALADVPFEFIFFIGFIILQFLISILARSRSWWAGGIVGALGGVGVGTLLALSLATLIPLVIGFTLFGLLFDYIVSRGYQSAKARGVTPPWWAGGSGGHSSGGGFGGFGGGGSGGGGASGSW